MKQNVIVKDSGIHGRGVFANKDFKKGDIVLKWNPKFISKEEGEKLSQKEKEFLAFNNGKYFLMQIPERYVNHSCEPNTNSMNMCDIAIKDIKSGEEITSDYSKDLAPGVKMKCNCGSKNCRGVIENGY